ncbi:8-oxo-dGTP diphosphatase [Pseudomonas monsensis]
MSLGEMTPVGGTWDPCGFSTPVAAPMTSASVVSPRLIRIAAALLLGPDGRTLLVRKRNTRAFMQPGGKIEAHETPLQALARELEEELGLCITAEQASFLGQFSAPAANEPGFTVQAELFQLSIAAQVTPAAEIEEVIWIDPATDGDVELAPLTRDLILPFYRDSLTAIA